MSLQGVRGVVLVGGWLIGRVVIDSSPLAVRFLGVRPGGWSVPSVSGWFCGVAAPSVSDCLLVWVLFWGWPVWMRFAVYVWCGCVGF